jgi:NAD(P)-dependent dehydrogenase (short-subunit alcohol dehydrogenase family)
MNDRVALVTGGASGIGRTSALALAEAGARVAVADTDASGANDTARSIEDEHDTEALAVEADVSEAEDVQHMVAETVERFGRLDAAVNNAGLESTKARLADYDEADFDRMIDVNLRGVFLCMKHELRQMTTQRDDKDRAIVNVASALGTVAFREKSAYVAAKHGVIGLTKSAALEYAGENIRANAVSPSFIETSMQMRTGTLLRPEQLDDVTSLHPLGRFGQPAEVAQAIRWLASPEASFVTGAALPVDGGYTAQ